MRSTATRTFAHCLVILAIGSFSAVGTVYAQVASPGAKTELVDGVDVSLGRQEVKAEVAQQLGIEPAAVPLSVRLPPEVAREACAQDDLSSSGVSRSCTAIRFTPALADAAARSAR